MDAERFKLVQDLGEKLNVLCAIFDQPALHVAEYFFEMRNRIDYDAEKLLQDYEKNIEDENTQKSVAIIKTLDKYIRIMEDIMHGYKNVNLSEKEKRQKPEYVHQAREKYIGILKEIEQELLNKLPDKTEQSNIVYADLIRRVEEFAAMSNQDVDSKSLTELEDTYIQLACEIIDETNELEKRAFDNQTIFYNKSRTGNSLGPLIHLKDDFIKKNELECFLTKMTEVFHSEDKWQLLYQQLERCRMNSMVVAASQSFNLTKNMVVIERLDSFLKANIYVESDDKLDGNYLVFESSRKTENNNSEACTLLESRDFSINISGKKIKSLDSALSSLFEHLEQLFMANTLFESFDTKLLAKCTKMHQLQMHDFCSPDANFNIGFLTSLRQLKRLSLTLPEMECDFGVFKELKHLENLDLESCASQDANKKYPKLSKDTCAQLATKRQSLSNLSLLFFEIEATEQEILEIFKSISYLELISIKTQSIDSTERPLQDAEANSLTRDLANQQLPETYSSTLHNCGIENVPAVVFRSFFNLKYLDMSQNRIRSIKIKAFIGLVNLFSLKLDRNPIEDIDDYAFFGLDRLQVLSLSRCKLKSINNRMFKGLKQLDELKLDENQIDSFIVKTKDDEFKLTSANLTSDELAIVREHLYHDLKSLTRLSLSGNRLEKIDLNLFCNLTYLNLSRNNINELNREIQPGTLWNLQYLYLQENRLTFIHKEAFSESIQLKDLNLSGNNLERLDVDFFRAFPGLVTVDLQGNNLSITITRETFPNFQNRLMNINLHNNKMVRIEDGAFQQMLGLSTLSVDLTTSFTGLPASSSCRDAFVVGHIPPLKTIFLQHSTPEILHDFLFRKENHAGLKLLKTLAMTSSSLQSLDSIDFKKMLRYTRLTELDLSKNQLTTIESRWLEGLSQLLKFNVSHNLIASLDEPDLFKSMPKLQEINLSENKLQSINRCIFRKLLKLRSLDLSNNKLPVIDHGLFRGLLSLSHLDLSGNGISHLNLSKIFESCRSLERLHLSNNQLDHQTINEESMKEGAFLVELTLANNRLVTMDFVRNLRRLEMLDVSNNKIESVEKDGLNLLGRLMKLTHLNLSDNQIRSLRADALSHLKHQLIHLYL